ARFTGRKPGTLNHAERGAAWRRRQTRVSEICMVEDVEYLRAKLRTDRFPNLRVFEDRKIDVVKAGPGEGIASQIAEVYDAAAIDEADRYRESRTGRTIVWIGRIAYGIAKPLVGFTDHLHRSNEIGPDGRHAGEGADGRRRGTAGENVKRVACLVLND